MQGSGGVGELAGEIVLAAPTGPEPVAPSGYGGKNMALHINLLQLSSRTNNSVSRDGGGVRLTIKLIHLPSLLHVCCKVPVPKVPLIAIKIMATETNGPERKTYVSLPSSAVQAAMNVCEKI